MQSINKVEINKKIKIKNINNETKFKILMFRAIGTKIKNSPSYINKNKIIRIKLILYCILIFVKDLKPHS